MDIIVHVVNQTLHIRSNLNNFVEGSQNFVRFSFVFTSEWEGLKKFAQFRQNGHAYNIYLDENNCVYLPPEITAGSCMLMLYGSVDSIIGTTNYLTLKINKNHLITDAESTEISESLYNQLVTSVSDLENRCDEIGESVFDLESRLSNLEEKGTNGDGAGIHIGPDEPEEGIDVWIDTDDSGTGSGGGAGGYYIPAVTDNGDGTATFGFSPSAAELPAVESVTVALPKGEKGEDGIDGVYTGDSAGIQQYLYDLADAGISVARFEGTYTISEKTFIPGGMTVLGGTFVSNGPVWMFSAQGDNVRLVNVTLKADRTDRRPDIYEGNSYSGTGTCSNVVGFFSEGHDGVGLIHCVCDGIIPVKFNNGSGVIHGCTVNNAPMFVWGTNVRLIASDNQVSIGDTGLDKYYHVYYLDKDSTLTALHNRIRCDTAVAFADVYHLMTAGNDGTYRAKGIVDGDIVVGNFQKIIDCHYADLILKNCHIRCTNSGSWNEFGSMACSSFRYESCDLDYTGAAAQEFDSSMISGRDIPAGVAPSVWKSSGYSTCYVLYDGCRIVRTSSLPKRATFSNCSLNLTCTTAVANLCNVVGCHMVMRMDAAQCVGVIASSNAKFDFIGNRVEFLHPNTNVYLFRYAGLDGFLCNNTFSGVKAGTKLWYNDTALGVTQNNYLKEVASQ